MLILAAFAIWHPAPGAAPASVPERASPARTPRPLRTETAAVVYVAGAVLHPGLVRLPPGSRVNDAVRFAGGLRTDADAVAVNLAAKIRDGDEIAVPTVGEKGRSSRAQRKSKAKSHRKIAGVVNLNTADATALAGVPGIGSALAQRIIIVRENDGPFENLEQLLDVAGMTQAKLDRATSYLSI